MTWKTRKVSMQSGEYVESQTVVTEHYTTDGRFTIRPKGSMQSRRTMGFAGPLVRRWIWTGYRLTDTFPVPSYLAKTSTHRRVSALKAQAEKRAR